MPTIDFTENELHDLLRELDKAEPRGDTYMKKKLRAVLNPNPKWATWLSTRGQAAWMQGAGIIRSLEVIEPNVMQRCSRQCPTGYEICRVRAEVIDFDPNQIGPSYHPGDDGYTDQGYHNEWKWE